MYFVVTDLNGIDPMYQYSLSYFKKLFRLALGEAEKNDIVELRLQNLNEKATRIVFTDVSCGLFESHKKIFSFLICAAIKRQSRLVSQIAWSLLLRGPGIQPKDYKEILPNPDPHYFSAQTWYFLTVLSQKISELSQLLPIIKENLTAMKEYFSSENLLQAQIPVKTLVLNSNFSKLLLVKAISP